MARSPASMDRGGNAYLDAGVRPRRGLMSPRVTLRLDNCIDVLRTLDAESIDACVTDPPYELGFMGKKWDTAGVAFDPTTWREVLRVLKPGGHLLAFGGTRTYHRMTCAIEDAGFEIRDSLHWLYGSGFPKSLNISKAIDAAAGAERLPTGEIKTRHGGGAHSDKISQLDPDAKETLVTAPATPEAARWEGWGTALKPAFEPVVLACKPVTIGSCLSALRARLAAESSRSNRSEFVAAFASALRNVELASATPAGSCDPMDTSPFGWATTLSLSTVSSWLATWADLLADENTSTTSTASSTTTDSATLLFCLSRITGASTYSPESGFSSLVQLAGSLFLASLHKLNATRALAVIGSATCEPAGACRGEDDSHEPIVLARKPLIGIVAANVLAHGTGGLNIEACRVGFASKSDQEATKPGSRATGKPLSGLAGVDDPRAPFIASDNSAGRWPPNLLLTHDPECGDECAPGCPVAELDRQSGDRPSGAMAAGTIAHRQSRVYQECVGHPLTRSIEASSGGASRFFPCFRYVAKPSKRERGEGNTHCTVKPIALMRWLCKLVTPPGGVILDPFMGSGTTGIAAVQESFRFLGIEREEEYFKIAMDRIKSHLPPRPESK